MTAVRCPWCRPDGPDDVDPETLCDAHYAEHEGLSIAEVERRDAEQYAEYADTLS